MSPGSDRHLGLAEHLAGVELFGDDMDRAAARRVARLDRAGVRVEPRYLGSREGWMLTIRPRHRSTNHGESIRMKPASAMVPTPCSSRTALNSRSNASLPMPLLSTAQVASPRARVPRQACGVRLVGGDEHDLVAARLLDERAHVAAATGNQDGDTAAGHALWVADQSSAEFQLPALPLTVQPRWPASIRPISNDRLAGAFERSRHVCCVIGRDDRRPCRCRS